MPVRQPLMQVPVNKGLFDSLSASQSQARMHIFRQRAAFNDARTIELYLWNVKLGQALHFPLQICEVTLRNSEAAIFVADYGPEWWLNPAFEALLDTERRAELDGAEARIKKRNLPFTSDQMVSTLSFGFWACMLERKYFPKIWSKHLRSCFPHAPPINRHLDKIRDRAFSILVLRNSVFHHESLIGRSLSNDFSELVEFIGWTCPVTADWVKKSSCFQAVLRESP